MQLMHGVLTLWMGQQQGLHYNVSCISPYCLSPLAFPSPRPSMRIAPREGHQVPLQVSGVAMWTEAYSCFSSQVPFVFLSAGQSSWVLVFLDFSSFTARLPPPSNLADLQLQIHHQLPSSGVSFPWLLAQLLNIAPKMTPLFPISHCSPASRINPG